MRGSRVSARSTALGRGVLLVRQHRVSDFTLDIENNPELVRPGYAHGLPVAYRQCILGQASLQVLAPPDCGKRTPVTVDRTEHSLASNPRRSRCSFRLHSTSTPSVQRELLDPVSDLIAIQAEQLRRRAFIATAPPKRLNNQIALECLQVDAPGRQLEPAASDATVDDRKVCRFQVIAVRQQHRALSCIPQLANIAGPVILLEQRARGRRRPSTHFETRC